LADGAGKDNFVPRKARWIIADDRTVNFRAFLWHAVFLALASNFMDVGTVIPSMLIKAGGGTVALGLLTAIMLGGSSLMQLLFAGLLAARPFKKAYLLLGIHLRVAALLLLALLFHRVAGLGRSTVIGAIFVLIALFSLSGSFASISYVDILGKAIATRQRKPFFSLKQVVNSMGVFLSAAVVRHLLRTHDYPASYALLFLIAALLLWIATAGFWKIRETTPSAGEQTGLRSLLAAIPAEIRRNPALRRYLLIANSLGLGVSLLPFTIMYAKIRFGLASSMVGDLLLLRTIGMLAAGLVLYRLARRFLYRDLLVVCVVTGAAIPPLCLLLGDHRLAYELVFVPVGVFAASYKTAMSGILLEISSDRNRSFYAGLAGAGNILTTIFPLLAGWLLTTMGYRPVFLGVALVVAASGLFIRGLDCRGTRAGGDGRTPAPSS